MTRKRSTTHRPRSRRTAAEASPTPSAAALTPAALDSALAGAPPATVRAAQEATAAAAGQGTAVVPPQALAGAPRPALPLRARLAASVGVEQLLLFRVGGELFAAELGAVEEAVDLDDVRPLPEVTATTLGVVKVRERLVVLYSPAPALGVTPAAPAVALLTQHEGQRAAIAVDEVEDVIEVGVATVRPLPGAGDDVAVGICRRGRDIVTLVDWEALVAGCLADRVPEAA
jgi:chemotaxis signal transduction protein